MFASIASYIWGSSTGPSIDGQVEDGLDIKNDIASINCNGDENSAPEETPMSLSLSDEEAEWVFVGNGNKSASLEALASDKESEISLDESEPVVEKESKRTNRKPASNHGVAPRPRHIPSSALHASAVLDAMAELRPQQKAQRRQRELRLKHKQLDRSNKALLVESSSNRPNRRRAMYSPNVSSRAVNNRKC